MPKTTTPTSGPLDILIVMERVAAAELLIAPFVDGASCQVRVGSRTVSARVDADVSTLADALGRARGAAEDLLSTALLDICEENSAWREQAPAQFKLLEATVARLQARLDDRRPARARHPR